jgi:hypothetical protein
VITLPVSWQINDLHFLVVWYKKGSWNGEKKSFYAKRMFLYPFSLTRQRSDSLSTCKIFISLSTVDISTPMVLCCKMFNISGFYLLDARSTSFPIANQNWSIPTWTLGSKAVPG